MVRLRLGFDGDGCLSRCALKGTWGGEYKCWEYWGLVGLILVFKLWVYFTRNYLVLEKVVHFEGAYGAGTLKRLQIG